MPAARQLEPAAPPIGPGLHGLEYCCPRCKGDLIQRPEEFGCDTCRALYPVVMGIPDFRVFPDPYISIEDDYAKGARLEAQAATTDLRSVVDFYWSITPDIAPELAPRYTRYALAGPARGRRLLGVAVRKCPGSRRGPGSRFLELGCRTGGLLVAGAEEFEQVVGIDIAFRWLIVARKRMKEAGLAAQLVCCCAQNLPFRSGNFDLILAESVLEHTPQQEELMAEAHRNLRSGGVFFAVTWNRYSLAPNPQIGLWGTGFLSRRLAARYIQWRRSTNFEHVYQMSRFQIKRLARRAGFSRCRLELPEIGEEELAGLPTRQRWMVKIYHAIKEWPLVRSFLLVFGPVLQLICVAEPWPAKPSGCR